MTPTLIEVPEQLGHAHISAEHLAAIVAASLDLDRVVLTSVQVDDVDYAIGSIATGALLRCSGLAEDSTGHEHPWRIFVKQLQSPAHWPMIHVVPPELREVWIESFPWRLEIDAFRSSLGEVLPAGLRLPRLYDIVEIDPLRAAIWMEDVDVHADPWSLAQFTTAAELLGELAGRRPIGTHATLGNNPAYQEPGLALRMYVGGRLRQGVAPMLADDALWQHPALTAALEQAGEATIRAELRVAFDELDHWLAVIDALPQTYVHGDASPQNLLATASDPTSFVVIDWGFNTPHCVGFDLGQLLIGLAHADELVVADLPPVHEAIVPAYASGLASAGFAASADEIQIGYLASLMVRSLYTALPLEELGAPDSPTLRARLVSRLRLTRYLLTLRETLS